MIDKHEFDNYEPIVSMCDHCYTYGSHVVDYNQYEDDPTDTLLLCKDCWDTLDSRPLAT